MLERCLRAGNNLFDLHSCYTQWAWFLCVDKLEEIMVYGLEQVNELAILCMGHKQLHSTPFQRRFNAAFGIHFLTNIFIHFG